MVCPACGGTMHLNKEKALCLCHNCDYTLSDKEFNDDYVFWFCDNCEANLNKQPGFDIKGDRLTCTECGLITN
jgi:ssDNA-binding Zn-finger/Zn-ribbon topoisomerase 1